MDLVKGLAGKAGISGNLGRVIPLIGLLMLKLASDIFIVYIFCIVRRYVAF